MCGGGSRRSAEKTGFVPNVFLALARRPAEFRAFVAYHDALMDKETPGLSKADREMIVVATSAANDCTYCVVAHGAILRIRAKDPLLADQVATNYRHADITAAAAGDARLRAAGRRPSPRPSRTSTWPSSPTTGSTPTTSGTSARSRRCSRSPTGWRT